MRVSPEWEWSRVVQEGKPLLHIAAQGGNIELVDWLIDEHGLDVHQWINVSAGSQYWHSASTYMRGSCWSTAREYVSIWPVAPNTQE